jgi:hypothetical protein
MPIPGRLSEIGCLKPIDQVIEQIGSIPLPEAFKIPLRVATGVLPAFAGSLFFKSISPLFVLTAIILTYFVMLPAQQGLFEFTPRQKHWSITLPVHSFFLGWAALLAVIGNSAQIGRSIGGMVLIVAVAIWPVYMGSKGYKAKQRKVPFKLAYTLVSSVVILQQILIIGGKLK